MVRRIPGHQIRLVLVPDTVCAMAAALPLARLMAHDDEEAEEHFNMVDGILHVPDVSVTKALGVMQHGVPSLTPCVLTTAVFLAGKFAKNGSSCRAPISRLAHTNS